MRKRRESGDSLTTKKTKVHLTKKRDEKPPIVRKKKKRAYHKKAQ